MTTEWDNTPWAGTPVIKATITRPARRPQKAVTALGPWATGLPISSLVDTPQRKAAAYLRAYAVGWFNKAGRKISQDMAALPWHVADGDNESDDPNESLLGRPDLDVPFEQLSPIDQFQRLMERPNPRQTGRQLRERLVIRRDFGGAAFWFLDGVAGPDDLPTAIYGISPTRMWPSYDRGGNLIGWVMDRETRSDGGVPFSVDEILVFEGAGEHDVGMPDWPFGVSVVEAVASHVPLSDLYGRHTADLLATGGRLAGMLWPKERQLEEAEYEDVVRAWRNVSSDPNAARRLLVFPEPMEWSQGAASPTEIGLPELAEMTMQEILTAFPISPYQLGVPTPGGLNSAETRREDRRDYWEGCIHPRIVAYDEVIQVRLLSRYERAMGQTFDYKTDEPNLDDANTLLEKVGALRALAAAGFDERNAVKVVGLGHIKFNGIPVLPEQAPEMHAQVTDSSRQDQTVTRLNLVEPPKKSAGRVIAEAIADSVRPKINVTHNITFRNREPWVSRGTKARDDIARHSTPLLADFFEGQRDRVVSRLREVLPSTKAARSSWVKAEPEWWDSAVEDAALREVVRQLYVEAGREGLQVVADGLDRIVPNKAVGRIVADLVEHGGERIADINAKTLQAITIELAEGTRRGYSIAQLIDGVPDEGFRGVLGVGLDNGVGVWGDARAEMIARTETAISYNRAALRGYEEFGVHKVVAIDGDGDPDCAARNGREFEVSDALSIADHPNGTLDWSPVV